MSDTLKPFSSFVGQFPEVGGPEEIQRFIQDQRSDDEDPGLGAAVLQTKPLKPSGGVVFHAHIRVPFYVEHCDFQAGTIQLMGTTFPLSFSSWRVEKKLPGHSGLLYGTFYVRQSHGHTVAVRLAHFRPFEEGDSPSFSVAGRVVRTDAPEGEVRIMVYPERKGIKPFVVDVKMYHQACVALQWEKSVLITGFYSRDHELWGMKWLPVTLEKPLKWRGFTYDTLRRERTANRLRREALRLQEIEQK